MKLFQTVMDSTLWPQD